jgi:membrane fusion protein (multidrug efflux system)
MGNRHPICCGWLLLFVCLLPALAGAAGPAEPSLFEARGVVKARQRAVIASELAALVKRLPLRAGEGFKAGDLLVGFDCRLFEAQRDKVRAELEAAKMRYENSQQLEKMSSIGVLEVQLAGVEVKKAEAESRIAALNVERCTIKAPYDGRVVRMMANEQESVKLQQELIEIVGIGSLEAEIVVPGSWLKWLTPGRKLTMSIDETGENVPATVSTVGASMDPASQSLIVCARLQGKKGIPLIPGMRGMAHFNPPLAERSGESPVSKVSTEQ